ncbi:DUF3368 domain-containing protein [Oscillatoria sp. FACHB-1406]|uniref:DUF3368 domain-containing protein n=1 Tax=Oscillatoria sp. FACHB-1406 TaxID=2692846 RepID=UPI001685B6DD|nr:DUF3368 domain-containing protein [Oscillatoria sp. FACHB-1406]MBD2579471.1 DUF3368 domain-containing protein [Oscillatoria sp. FACHB-1406]
MIVVSDTSPINYLLLIDRIDLLPQLFQQIIIPDVVRDEMLAPLAPPVLQQWITNPPPWLIVQPVSGVDATLSLLDPGEQAAITLAQTLPADLLIIDERLGRRIARERKIAVIGTIGILDDAARQGFIELSVALDRLQQTNFRISRRIVQDLLKNNDIQRVSSYVQKAKASLEAAQLLTEKQEILAQKLTQALSQRFPDIASLFRTENFILDIKSYITILSYCLVCGNTDPADSLFMNVNEVKQYCSSFNIYFDEYIDAVKFILSYIKLNHGLSGQAAEETNNYIERIMNALP